MLSRMKNFLMNHKRGIAIGGLVIGGSVLAVRYAQRKLHEYQMDQAKTFLEKTRRTQHFEATERTCNQVITNLAPSLCEEILAILNTDEILEQLRKNPENKTELWNELKVLSFARLTTLVYASSMLVIALRVQVNLVGGYVYKDNAPNSRGTSSPPQDQVLPNDLMQTYLGEIQYFLKEGVEKLAKTILDVTRKILQDYKLKKQLTLTDMEQIFWAIQMSVNATPKEPNGHIPEYIFNRNADLAHNPTIKQLVMETTDVLECEEVAMLAANNVSRGFSIVVDHLAEYLTETVQELQKTEGGGEDQSQARVTNPNTIQMALAKLIPIVNGLTAKPFNMTVNPPNLSTALVTLFMLSDKLKILGVNVYELFSTS